MSKAAKAAKPAPDAQLQAEPFGVERAEAKRLAKELGVLGQPEEVIARRLASYRVWLRGQWLREQADRVER